MNRTIAAAVVSAALLGSSLIGAQAATASPVAASTTISAHAVANKPKPKKYKNCTALRKVYPHGVGKKGAKDKVSGKSKPVTNFTVSNETYKLNTKSDRDKDGIACEKH